MIGRTISHYEIVEKLGEGGMGVVYKANDTKLDRFVALKFLAPHLLRDDEARKRFEREAKAAARLDHPNICTVYEIDEAEGRTFIVMAFLEGRPLNARIKEGPLKLPEALSVAMQMAEGLEAAHEKGITHRDIKPDNLMLMAGSRGLVKIMDFGLAQLAGGSKFTREGTTLGTMAYMSPEQAGGAETDGRTDIWSLGVVLYEMVAGQPPFRGDYDQVVVYSLMNEDPEPLTTVRTGVPKELERIVNKCLAKEPASRFQDVEDLLVDLRGLQKEQQAEAATRSRPAAAPAESSHRTPRLLVGAAAFIVLAVAAGAFLGLFESDKPASVSKQSLQTAPLTTYPGSERAPAFSPDGEQVVFSWNGENEDNFDLYTLPIGGTTPQRLTTDPGEDFSPAWSPDGRFIAFLRRTAGDRLADVLIKPAIGGPERKVGRIHNSYFVPQAITWSPGGSHLIVVDRSVAQDSFALFSLSIEGGEKVALTSPPADSWGDDSPAFSPDGNTLCFARWASYNIADIHLLPLTGDLEPDGDPERLVVGDQSAHDPNWTPDGKEIVYLAGRRFGAELWRVEVSGGAEPERVGSGVSAGSFALAPLGDRLAYVQGRFDANIHRWRRSLPGGSSNPPTRFLSSTKFEHRPQYSPDGGRIAFISNRSGDRGVWLADADGSNARFLGLGTGTQQDNVSWSPDGRRLAIDMLEDGNWDIYVVSPAGGNPLRLTDHPADDFAPSWSHDGSVVYFESRRGGPTDIWKVSAAGGEPVRITREGGFHPAESPDGRFVYYAKEFASPTTLWKAPVAGGEETEVLGPLQVANFWVAPDGIYFMRPPEPGDPEAVFSVRFFDLATEGQETIFTLPPNAQPWAGSGLGVSPDEQTILYTQADNVSSDLMLLEGLR